MVISICGSFMCSDWFSAFTSGSVDITSSDVLFMLLFLLFLFVNKYFKISRVKFYSKLFILFPRHNSDFSPMTCAILGATMFSSSDLFQYPKTAHDFPRHVLYPFIRWSTLDFHPFYYSFFQLTPEVGRYMKIFFSLYYYKGI